MATYTRYRNYQGANWNLWVLPEIWSQEYWAAVLKRIEEQRPAKHPQTVKIRLPDITDPLFLKVFHGSAWFGTFKDLWRQSKAVRSLRNGEVLSDLGFHVPRAIAAGERRDHRILKRGFLLTLPVSGNSLPIFLRARHSDGDAKRHLLEKRYALKQLAMEIRRLHDLGFIHGDLVPSNILVSNVAAEGVRFVFLDNDRTRLYPKWFPQSLWKRNLVQLNRFPLAGISLQDRMRFLHSYLGRWQGTKRDRHLARWLEKKTRQRRRECDAVDVSGSFRKLMRWDSSAS
jgi:Lipopolysaccharide kinase (Kdo/WaaP) family